MADRVLTEENVGWIEADVKDRVLRPSRKEVLRLIVSHRLLQERVTELEAQIEGILERATLAKAVLHG